MLSLRRPAVRRTAGGTLLAGLVAGGLIVGSAGSAGAEDAPVPLAVAPDAAPPAIGAVQPDQAQSLKVFRRAHRPSDDMPADVAAAVGPGRFGRNPALARAIKTPTGTGWVVPGNGTICLVAPDPVEGYGVTCSPTGVVQTDGITLGNATEDRSTAVTLVPDGSEVTVVDDDHTSEAATPDSSGVVAVTDAEKVDRVDVKTDDGVAKQEILDEQDFTGGSR